MPNIPQINVGGTVYKLKDAELRENIVLAQNARPTNENNRIWLQENSEERQVPTWEEFSNVKNALGTVPSGKTAQSQITNLQNALGNVPSGQTAQGQITDLKNALGTVPSGKTAQSQITDLNNAIANVLEVDKFFDNEVLYRETMQKVINTINISNTNFVRILPSATVLVPAVKNDVFTVLAKVRSSVSNDYIYAIRLRKYTSAGVTGVYYYSDEFTDSIIAKITIAASDAEQCAFELVRRYTGTASTNYSETFDVEYLTLIRGDVSLNEAVSIDSNNIPDKSIENAKIADGTIAPVKLTSLTDKYGIILRYGVKCPNYDTTAQQLTIYKNTVIIDLLTGTELIRTSDDVVLDASAGSQASQLVFDTSTNEFKLAQQGRRSSTEIYLGSISRATGYGQLKCHYTINGYPVGSDKLLTEFAEKMPTAWQSEIETINTAKCDKFTFAIQTDTHYYLDYGDTSAYNLKLLTNYVGFNFVANLGDVIRGYADETIDSPENMRSAMTDIMHRYVTGISCPLMIAMGNHDTNKMWADAFYGEPFSLAEVWGREFKPAFNTNPKAVTKTGFMYYYTDFDDVRVIVLDTQDGGNGAFGIGQVQIDWLANTALNTNKAVLILSHVPLIDGWSVSSNYVSSYANAVSAIKAFQTNGGTVIGCMSGHTHTQESKTVDSILYVTFRNGADLCEVVQIDLNAKTINTIPVGFTGVGNRNFTFV